MNNQTQKDILARGLFEALGALYATSTPPNSAVAAVVEGYMVATREKLGGEETVSAKPKQRRARRKKPDMVDVATAHALAKSAASRDPEAYND